MWSAALNKPCSMNTQVPEFIDPVFVKTSSKRSFSMTENERFGLVFAKTGSINSGKGVGESVGAWGGWWRLVTQQADEQLNIDDLGRNSLLGKSKKIAKFLMRTFTCRSTFLYGAGIEGLFSRLHHSRPTASPSASRPLKHIFYCCQMERAIFSLKDGVLRETPCVSQRREF
jgi:hypothetical protein